MIGVPACEVSDVRSREMILIQGVIDACFEEDGQIILVEYKTDFVKEGNEEAPVVQALIECLQSEEVRAFMEEEFGGAVIPMF